MKRLPFLITFLICMITEIQLFAQSDQLKIVLSDSNKPFKLNVNIVNGSINIEAYNGKDIYVSASSQSDKDNPSADGLKRLVMSDRVELNAQENANVVTIGTKMVNKTINFKIRVPATSGKFNISTNNNGNITINNATGEFEIINVNGYINMTNINGSVVANTINGDVKVKFKIIEPGAVMAFSTLNGNVDITLPPTAKFNPKLKSDKGEVYTDFRLVSVSHHPNYVSKNPYKINLKDWTYSRVNGGGPEILLKTMNGNIYLRKLN